MITPEQIKELEDFFEGRQYGDQEYRLPTSQGIPNPKQWVAGHLAMIRSFSANSQGKQHYDRLKMLKQLIERNLK